MFVDLDFDLYQPTLDGLEFFYPKMVSGGVIVVHDYYNEEFKGVKDAVLKFQQDTKINLFSIGDAFSVAIIKP